MARIENLSVFDHRTRDWRRRWRGQYVGYFASDPMNGVGERRPRVRTLLLPGWRIDLQRTRKASERSAPRCARHSVALSGGDCCPVCFMEPAS